MLRPFIQNFTGLEHLKEFKFDKVLTDDKKAGNLFGELILAKDLQWPLDCYQNIHPCLDGVFVEFLYGYPIDLWERAITMDKAYDDNHKICREIKREKLEICTAYWRQREFIIPKKGVTTSIDTQIENTCRFLSLRRLELKRLSCLTINAILWSGMFGKTIPTKANFN